MVYIDDLFCSIQGESSLSGLPTVFVRLFGCPIGCVYCDQPQLKKNRKKISTQNIVNKINKEYKWCKYVCITGGEPLIYEEVLPLTYELQRQGYTVSIETSGCIPIEEATYQRSYRYIMDIKGPSSGVKDKNIYENLIHLHRNDEVKFVVKDREDYDFMKSTLKRYPTSASILVSPMFKGDNMLIGNELVKWIIEDHLADVRVQVQLHKIIGVK